MEQKNKNEDNSEEERDDWGRTKEERDQFFADRQYERNIELQHDNKVIDAKLGFEPLSNEKKLGWLINMHPSTIIETETKKQISAVDYYFLQEDGERFKATFKYNPYFFIGCKPDTESDVELHLKKIHQGVISNITIVDKEDLDLKNHLVGFRSRYLKIEFTNVNDLMNLKKELFPIITLNKESRSAEELYFVEKSREGTEEALQKDKDVMTNIIDIREYDVPYHVRVAIDNSIYVGRWYDVTDTISSVEFTARPDLEERPDPIIMAYDIETTKLPLKFPDSSVDSIMMISYMIDGQGFLIVNREIVSEDIEDFEYTPKPEYEGPFTIFNEVDEEATIRRFLDHILETKPMIMVTFNGDFFDWPFVDKRAEHLGISLFKEIGYYFSKSQDQYKSRPIIHMDAFKWVQRDSYLPMGSQGLKAVTKAKLGYDPLEIDPEDMCRFASERPQILANYSVSDAVATYYLYMKYVHPFIFSLCSIIPMEPDEVLRKGSGTLCEVLLMVEAYNANVIMPNKYREPYTSFHEGHVLESQTYVGGHVEALESGVFRSDIPEKYNLDVEALEKLRLSAPDALKYTLVNEMNIDLDTISNFDEVAAEVQGQIQGLIDTPKRIENPLIYHLDVSAMYPNIILTNRLQPSALVDRATCASCSFNNPASRCQRKMDWKWRGQYTPATKTEYESIKAQLDTERFPNPSPIPFIRQKKPMVNFYELPPAEQAKQVKARLNLYAKKVYKKTKITQVSTRKSTVCMRENPFYIDTVRAFRDRRYIYKGKLKEWQGKLSSAANDPIELQSVKNMIVLYDSLQLAHKCILNSFYGYVMRKGARWFSMEMAGIVCLTGSSIIQKAREIVDGIGKPLELDTDGIWCTLPCSFPENVVFKRKTGGKNIVVSYPGAMLNMMVGDNFTNDQYQDLEDKDTLKYSIKSENSIIFEVDGPYKAMILPASKEEDKKLKKRYAVYNFDGSLAELKGFELKRRGELQLIKAFQGQVFERFLEGENLQECYESVAAVANQWLDILFTKGKDLKDDEIFDLISENRTISKELSDYGAQKSTSLTSAKRMGEFLGSKVIEGKGLACRFVISSKPIGAPVTERAIPVTIFKAEENVKKHYLKKWLKQPSATDFDVRTILDWKYYIDRLGGTIQKLITIPAALQMISNPVPRLKHPDWLFKRVVAKDASHKQKKMGQFFQAKEKKEEGDIDIEDCIGGPSGRNSVTSAVVKKRNKSKSGAIAFADEGENEEEKEPEIVSISSEQYAKLFGPVPDKSEDYQTYINYMRAKWRWQIKMREERKNNGSVFAKSSKLDSGFRSFKKGSVNQRLMNNHWQIVQILPSTEAGRFQMWAFVDGEMFYTSLMVPRIFYVSCGSEDKTNRYPKVNRQLPRSQPSSFLYEFKMSEKAYNNLVNLRELSSFFNHPDVESVYETDVPLIYRAILALGCVCKVRKGKVLNQKNLTLDLEDLLFQHTDRFSYLEENTFEHIFICHNGGGARGVYGIFTSTSNEATIIVVDEKDNRLMPKPSRLYKETLQAFLEEAGDSEVKLPQNLNFNIEYFKTETQACKSLQQHITKFREGISKPVMAVLQFTNLKPSMFQSVPGLNSMPHVVLKSNVKDDEYPPLQWESFALSKILENYIFLVETLPTQIAYSRYGHVPLGNMPQDYVLYLSDVFYSRQLQRQGHILWASSSLRPDIGGREDEDNLLMADLCEESSFEINNAGAYDTICVEIEIELLAINSILHSTKVHDAEGVSDGNAFTSANKVFLEDFKKNAVKHTSLSYDNTAACMPAFQVLKSNVSSLYEEVVKHSNYFANDLIIQFYRWLTNPKCLLYDPALHRLIQTMMKKVFLQLIIELRRLGADLVFASFKRIVLKTNKRKVSEAREYINFVLRGIKKQEMFSTLSLTPAKYWEQLWWLDKWNFVGMSITEEYLEEMEGQAQTQTQTLGVDDEDFGPSTQNLESSFEINLNIKEYLPIPLQRPLQLIIGNFVHDLHQFRMDKRFNRRANGEFTSTPAAEFARRQLQEIDSDEILYMKELVGTVADKMYEILPDIKKNNTYEFPELPGSYLKLKDPSMEFVKYVVQILSLNSNLINEVDLLRKTLFRLIGVSEFSADSYFKNPCLSYTLKEVICKLCNDCRELDLCRDTFLIQRNWNCPNCQNPYDKKEIEQTLVNVLGQKVTSYQLQDLTCKGCNLLKKETMNMTCTCSAPYDTKINRAKFLENLQTFQRIAQYHEFELLNEMVSWNLNLSMAA